MKARETYLALYDKAARAWPVASAGRMVDTSYGQTFVRTSGPADGPPLVLLPTAGHCSLMWKPNIASLSERCRAYAVDTLINTGCVGRSVCTRAVRGPDDAAVWLDELIRGLELGSNVDVVGVSYGGWLTGQYALRFPQRLRRIVLLAPAATVLPVRWAFYLRALLPGLVPLGCTYRGFLHWVFSDLGRENAGMLADIVNHGLNEVLYSPRKAVQRLNQVAPRIQAEVIPDAGHDLTFVRPEMVHERILGFLARP